MTSKSRQKQVRNWIKNCWWSYPSRQRLPYIALNGSRNGIEQRFDICGQENIRKQHYHRRSEYGLVLKVITSSLIILYSPKLSLNRR